MKSIFVTLFIITQILWSTNAGLNDRLDCFLEVDFKVDQKSCEERGCIWDPQSKPNNIPFCYLDTKKVGYKTVSAPKKSDQGIEVNLQMKPSAKSTFKKEQQIENLKVEVTYLTDRILRIKVVDPKNTRYEVPIQKDFPLLQKGVHKTEEKDRKYSVELSESKDDFSFSISRKDSKTKLFDTSIGGLVYSDQFLQLATKLPTKNIYGLGENFHQQLRHDFTHYQTFPLFSQDIGTNQADMNEYGVHPFYTVLEESGRSHGVLMLSSNAMEYTLLPEPGLSFKTTGGVLDFFVFVGENPENVIELYTSLIGRPTLPPFWGLGYQLTRWGFKNTNDAQTVLNRNVAAKIPLDVMYFDIDYMDRYHDFSYNHDSFKNLPEFIRKSKAEHNLHWTLILDPAIGSDPKGNPAFKDGYDKEVFVKWDKSVPKEQRWNPPNAPSDKDVFYGHVWPSEPAAFPDFFKNVTQDWWQKWIGYLHNDLDVKFDALWIDMNEPSNINDNKYTCPNNKYDFPATRIKPEYARSGQKSLSHNTMCMTTVQGNKQEYLHYNVHSLYGITEMMATQKAIHAVTGKRGFTVSRSTYVSSGRYGNHWLGDNASKWPHMRASIIGILEFNFFGIPFVGPDICGFGDNTTPELCKRWSALGAFYPFSRNHNCIGNIDQDPAVWAEKGHPEVTDAARNSLRLRYMLLHYSYTLYYKAHTLGQTVARPVFHEFPTDSNTFAIHEQFMLGRSILVSPFLYEKQTEVKAYLPEEHWYRHWLWTEGAPKENETGHVTFPDNKFGVPPVHIRGGTILPYTSLNQDQLINTHNVRNSNISLAVFPAKDKTASGDLFWDDGDAIDTIENNKYNYYSFDLNKECVLEIKVQKSGYSSNPSIERIVVKGLNGDNVEATLDGKPIKAEAVQDTILIKANINLKSKKSGEKWTLKWKSTKTDSCNTV